MKSTAFSLLVFLALTVFTRADTVGELVAKGCPSPDREWHAKDYSTFKELVTKGTLALPRLESESGRAILRRMVDTENLSFYRNRNLPLDVRLSELISLIDSSKSILLLYVRAANAKEKVEKELADVLVFQLAVASVTIDLTTEYLPTIPKDENYEARMAGFAKVKSGLTIILDGAVTSLSERTLYSDESIAKIAQGICQYYPGFDSLLPETVKMEFSLKIEGMLSKEKNPIVKRELDSLYQKLKGKLKSAVNKSEPSHGETNQMPSAPSPGR